MRVPSSRVRSVPGVSNGGDRPPVESPKPKVCGIYAIINTHDNRFYVGQSNSVRRRVREHAAAAEQGTHCNFLLRQDFERLGPAHFQARVLEECPESQLDKREDYWMLELNAYYNLRWSDNSKIRRSGGRIIPRQTPTKLRVKTVNPSSNLRRVSKSHQVSVSPTFADYLMFIGAGMAKIWDRSPVEIKILILVAIVLSIATLFI